LAGEAGGAVTAEDVEELFFGVVGGAIKPALLGFRCGSSARGGATRKRNGREVVVADVDELSAFSTSTIFAGPMLLPRNSIFGTGWAIAKTSRPFNERTETRLYADSLVGKTACFPRQLSAILGKACRNPDVPRPPRLVC